MNVTILKWNSFRCLGGWLCDEKKVNTISSSTLKIISTEIENKRKLMSGWDRAIANEMNQP